MSECQHDDLMEFDCMNPCPVCGKFGPHRFTEDPYCDICGQPYEAYFNVLRGIIGD